MDDVSADVQSFVASNGDISVVSSDPNPDLSWASPKAEESAKETQKPEAKPDDEPEKDPNAVALGKKSAEKRAAEREAASEKEPEGDEGDKAKQQVSEEIEKAPPEQKKKLASDRVAEATRRAAALQRELQAEREARENLQREWNEFKQRSQAPAEKKASDTDPEPKEEDFPVWGDWLREHQKWTSRQVASEIVAKEVARQRQAAAQHAEVNSYMQGVDTVVTGFQRRMAEAAKADPELTSKLDPRVVDLQPSFMLPPGQQMGALNAMADEILASDRPDLVCVYLSEHPEHFQRIATLRTQREVAREMAIISHIAASSLERVTAGIPPPKPKEVSKAPDPPRPVGGAPAIVEDAYRDDMSADDYIARNNAKIRERILSGGSYR